MFAALKLGRLFFIALSLLFTSFCTALAEIPRVEIGIITPLSGGWQNYSERLTYGLEMYRQEYQQEIDIQFHYEDEATCDSQKAFQAYRFLRQTKNIKIFFITCMNGARAILPAAKKEGVLVLSSGFQERDLFTQGALFINLALQISSEAQTLSDFIIQQKFRRVALLRSEGTDEFYTAIKERIESAGQSQVVFDQAFSGVDTDMSTLMTLLRKKNPDAVFVNLNEPLLIATLSHLRTQRQGPALLSSYGIKGLAQGNQTIQKLVPGLYFSYPEETAAAADLRKRILQKFHNEPVINSYFVYDGLELLRHAISQCSVQNLTCIYKTIANDTWRTGLSGRSVIHADGSIERKFFVRQFDAHGNVKEP